MKTLLPLFILLAAPLLHAADGSVHGRVYGQNEKGDNLGPVAHAKIELRAETGGAASTVTTNEYGYYQIDTLAVGAYRYKVAAAGFRDEDEMRGFAMPQDTREFVHDFLLTREPKSGSSPAQSNIVQPAVHGRVYGQTEKGDNLGPLPGAKVELLTSQGGRVVATATASSPGGYYEIKNLSPADYAYRVTAAGFAPEDAGRGFTVPQGTLEYVHDFILSKTPPKRDKCELAVLVVKLISSGNDRANDARLPVANARLVLQPSGNLPTPLNQPFVTDAKGEYNAKDLAEGSYTVAIDAPECEPFTGSLTVKCDKDGDVIFELKPCNELLHGYVRAMLNEGWGASAQAKAAAERAYQRAMKVDAKDGSVNYASALALLSAGDYPAAQQSLAAAIGKKSDSTTWDRACEARLWMNLCLHQPAQAAREMRSLAQNHYANRTATQAAKDTAYVCGIGLGLVKGPWQDQVSAGDAALLESELLSAFKGDLQAECAKARDHVADEYGKLKAAEDAARNTLMVGVTEKRNAELARLAERQTAISTEVAALDPDIQTLQTSVNQFDQQYRIQVVGFTQQQQANAVQLQALNGRLQHLSVCMAQDQVRMQAAAQQQMPQSPTTMQPDRRPGMQQPGAGTQAIMVEIQQHQLEIQQIRQQMLVIQNQNVQMGVNIANLQTQFNRDAGTAQADLNLKLQRRGVLATEFETLDRQRTAPFDPATFSTPEIDDLRRRERSLKTYCDLPLEVRREELLDQFDCGAAKEPKRLANPAKASEIKEPAFISTRSPAMNAPVSSANAPAAGLIVMPAQPVPENSGMPPLKPLPPSATAIKPPPNIGEPAEVVITNNQTGSVRIFGLSPGADNELFVRSLEVGEEAMIPVRIGQTLIMRPSAGGRELQRHKVGKKLEILKVGATPQ
ncbi:carboxypeptidase regulatory-like domain-containing protein [Prosthecobacter sp.]|uniref:carboxypeptidase regulatory-like domain-containing protein n=1 Tax=Prosthecobacter sp. TaxID=1965333 RepID=UPI0024889A1A|nr:carboxypeptidase regulatory-like domain-containing protein [Prosthecobacter sp.]MDI1314906.1 carboxypeptidase regulatory-like domain-containing protein [Prosthecobacter sp.]